LQKEINWYIITIIETGLARSKIRNKKGEEKNEKT